MKKAYKEALKRTCRVGLIIGGVFLILSLLIGKSSIEGVIFNAVALMVGVAVILPIPIIILQAGSGAKEREVDMLEGEEVIRKTSASRSDGNKERVANAQGGNLTLTNKRLVFMGHGMSVDVDKDIIQLEDITSYELSDSKSTLMPLSFPNAFEIHTNVGESHRFMVESREGWIREIKTCLDKS